VSTLFPSLAQEEVMPTYASFFRLASGTIAAAMKTPTDRAAAVERLVAEAGGHLESYYWMFGEYDGFGIIEVPDSKAVAALALAITSTGAFSAFVTHELIPAAEINDRLAEAKRLSAVYTPPGVQPG
jgi:uncharacterized protein with GYD domain